MILDSNIIIYSILPEALDLRALILRPTAACSAISCVEAQGFHRITEVDKARFTVVFETLAVLPVTDAIIEQATKLRQQRKMSLGDAIIAGTCLVHNQALVTRNTMDFDWIARLTLYNPFDPAAQILVN